MIRARFKANSDDYRPVKWPPPGPYWCAGHAVRYLLGSDECDENAIVVAYVDNEDQIKEFWPEASNIEAEEKGGYEFSDRFPKPDWFVG